MNVEEIIGAIRARQVIASGRGIRTLSRLVLQHGGKNWKKCKGEAFIRDEMATNTTRKSTGMKRTASASGTKKSSGHSKDERRYPYWVLCVENNGQEVNLQIGKAYQLIKPEINDPEYALRVIDEEREDYLYSANWFSRSTSSHPSVRS